MENYVYYWGAKLVKDFLFTYWVYIFSPEHITSLYLWEAVENNRFRRDNIEDDSMQFYLWSNRTDLLKAYYSLEYKDLWVT